MVMESTQEQTQVNLPVEEPVIQQAGETIEHIVPLPAPNSSTKKRRRVDGDAAGGRAKLTLRDKFDIISFFDQNLDQQNYALIARKYNVSRQTIRKVIMSRELILQDHHNGVPPDARRARVLPPEMVLLDERLLEFLSTIAAQSSPMLKRNVLPIGMEQVKAKATELAATLDIKINKGRSTQAPWVATNSWYARFCNRHNFIREPLQVESSMSSNPSAMPLSLGMPSQQIHMPPMPTMHHPQAMPPMMSSANSSMLAVMMDDSHEQKNEMHALIQLNAGDSSDDEQQ